MNHTIEQRRSFADAVERTRLKCEKYGTPIITIGRQAKGFGIPVNCLKNYCDEFGIKYTTMGKEKSSPLEMDV